MSEHEMLTPGAPDAFAPFYRTAAQARTWRRWAVALGALVAVQAVAVTLLALRPPFVLVHDHAGGQPPALRRLQLERQADVVDARLFFTQMATLRFGWQSGGVRRDLESFLGQCHPAHRKAQLRHLLAKEDAGARRGGARLAAEAAVTLPTRLDGWQRANLNNQLVLPEHWDEVHCRVRPQEPVWDCVMVAELVTTVGEPGAAAQPLQVTRQQATFVASLMEVPHTPKTPHGLLVAHLDMVGAAGTPGDYREARP